MSDPNATLLIVEDDRLTRTFLSEHLAADGYDPLAAGTLADARALLETSYPDLVLSDVMLPDGTGLDLIRHVRGGDGIVSRVDPATPVMLLSGRDGELDRIRGFERGCDDYLAKPFSYPELRLRIAALLERTHRRPTAGRVRVGTLELDPAQRTVSVRGARVALTQKEYALLVALVREPTRVYTKDELLRTVWGYRTSATVTRTIDSHACRLRSKLGVHGDAFVVNVWGVGYRLVDGALDRVAPVGVAA
ncbi:Phosphate regulon transcriptional regulatory protein PhoB (SphR) [Patulibacter medicamentivorans]|jgi:DNA-binding response OmpR family regulator|uniref:Phosphate regulon transcriptional regulatory protein PhoB (SphR) n=1 Tax=Patulibacter medicamentivorans TaxID=1097667 RepID=H0EBZ5_9ACTN|nr:response regulator transcription factor [Patulibacter medicamentivorans]EHN08799.1 Phosphate regulon transcriptional regulatory protein PhoB (SphR) [Patulibacter medicamentivorans]